MTETIKSTSNAASILFLGHNGEWWDFWLIASVIIAALAAAAIGVTTVGSIGAHKREAEAADRSLEEYKVRSAAEITAQRRESDEKISDANKEIARLSAEGKASQAAISEADARAKEATLALARLKRPRTLGPERQQLVVEAATPFSGQRYKTAISQGADDGPAFWESLYTALNKAGWVYLPASVAPSDGSPPAFISIAAIPGIEILFDPSEERLAPAALALGNALHADGTIVAVNRNSHSTPNEEERDIIMIKIGARVPPL